MKSEDEAPVLNLGCGDQNFGYVRLDIVVTQATNIVADAQNLPFRDQVFARAFEKNLLEHLRNPSQHLCEVHRVLRTGGALSLITDNAACLKFYTLGTHTGGYSKRRGLDKHYALFTKEHLRNHMQRAGFSVASIRYVDADYFTRLFDKLLRLFTPSLSYPRIQVEATKK